MDVICRPLTRDEVKSAIEHHAVSRPPVAMVKWWGEGLHEQYGDRLLEFEKYPEDCVILPMPTPAFEPCENGFCWKLPVREQKKGGLDNIIRLEWEDLDDLINNPPNLDAPGLFDELIEISERARKEGRYTLLHHWHLMFERIWMFRGMENLFMDYVDEPENVHRLHRFMCDFELQCLKKIIDLVHPDGYLFSDDLGSQRALMISPGMFREFIKPYYTELWSYTHSRGVQNWLHTCGCVTDIIDDLIECGLDVLHPIQKRTMDWDEVARCWKGKITFFVGMDVQQTLIVGTPDEVRREVRLMKDTFGSPEGGMILAAGNGIVSGTPLENIDAFLDECFR